MSKEIVKSTNKRRYEGLDGVRALLALMVLCVHVKANMGFDPEGKLSDEFFLKVGNFTFLFMILSAFAMCCGYYNKIIENKISVNDFYLKRYKRIWPFFAILVVLEVIMSPGKKELMEAFADLTLCYSFLPNPNISVIGVAWTLGVIFAFYIVFPFFCFLIGNKKRACFTLGAAMLYHIFCEVYFMNENHVLPSFNKDSNIIFCGVFFVIGGMIFLYKDQIVSFVNKLGIFALILAVVISALMYCFVDNMIIYRFVMLTMWFCYALGDNRKILSCKIAKILGGISMEVYLSHMIVINILKKLHIDKILGHGICAYLFDCVLVLSGAIMISYILKFIVDKSGEYGKRKKNKVG